MNIPFYSPLPWKVSSERASDSLGSLLCERILFSLAVVKILSVFAFKSFSPPSVSPYSALRSQLEIPFHKKPPCLAGLNPLPCPLQPLASGSSQAHRIQALGSGEAGVPATQAPGVREQSQDSPEPRGSHCWGQLHRRSGVPLRRSFAASSQQSFP